MKSFAAKAIIFITSSFLTLGIVEYSLVLLANKIDSSSYRIYEAQKLANRNIEEKNQYFRNDSYEEYNSSSGKKITLLSIGDSFTNAGNVSWKNSYPNIVYELFDKQVNVQNMGFCEDTTLGVYNRLKAHIESDNFSKNHDNYALILVGAADTINENPSSYFLTESKGKSSLWVSPREKLESELSPQWYENFKIYKLYQYVQLELQFRSRLNYISIEERTALAKDLTRCQSYNSGSEKDDCLKQSIKVFEANYPNDTESYIVNDLWRYIIYGLQQHFGERNYGDVFIEMLNFVRLYPEILIDNRTRLMLFSFAQMQNKIDPKAFYEKIIQYAKGNDRLKSDYQYFYFLKNIEHWASGRKVLNQRRKEIWDRIVKLARDNEIKLVLANYPVNYIEANRLISEISESYDLPLVDNRSVFEKLIKQNGVGRYIESDDHCTVEGYQVMSMNIYKKLKSLMKL